MCGGNKNTTTQTTSPTPQAMTAYSNLLTQAGNVAATPYQAYGGEGVAPVNAQQQSGISNINQYATAAEPYIQEAEGIAGSAATPITASQIENYENPYTQQVVNATENQFANTNAQQLQQVEGNAIAQGAFGGNREAVAQAETAGQQQAAEAPVIAGLENQGYTQGVNTALTEQQAAESGAANLGSLGVTGENAALTGANAQVGAGSLEQTTQQALDAYNYQQYLNQLAYPFQTTQYLAGIDTGVGSQMGGTSQTVGPAPNLFSELGGLGLGAAGLFTTPGGAGGTSAATGIANALQGLARGGAVIALARGGGVAADGVANRIPSVPESPRTLRIQQKQLIDGHRRVQMFPHGTRELPLPSGMSRVTVHGEVFHFNPKRIRAEDVRRLAERGDEHHLLDLGPFSKHEILARLHGGEIPVAVVERHPDGTEVRAAAGTHVTAPHQAAHMARTVSPGHHLHFEDPRFTVLGRLHHHRADGGMVPGFDLGGAATGVAGAPYGATGSPYGSAKLWLPQNSVVRGRGAPPPPKLPQQQQPNTLANQAKSVGDLAKVIHTNMNSPAQPLNIAPANGVASDTVGTVLPSGIAPPISPAGDFGDSGAAIYRRGGSVPRYASGGGDDGDMMLSDGVNPDLAAVAPDFYGETAMEAGRLPSITASSSRRGGRIRGYADGGGDDVDDAFGSVDTPPVQDTTGVVPAQTADSIIVPSGGYGGSSPTQIPTNARPVGVLSLPVPPAEADGVAAINAAAPAVGMGDVAPPDTSSSNWNRWLKGQSFLESPDGRPSDKSSAKGYFQFIDGTAKKAVEAGLPNPQTGKYGDQADATKQYIQNFYPDAAQAIDNGDFRAASKILNKEWPSLPGGSQSQSPEQYRKWAGILGGDQVDALAYNDKGATTSDAPLPAHGVVPASSFNWNWDKLGPALITAGGAMMASHSPFFGVGLGEGITAGAQSYEQQKREEQAANLNQQKIGLESKRLDQELNHQRDQLANETKRTDIQAKSEQSLEDWRKRMNLTPSGRETMDGHPIMIDKYSGQTVDGVTSQPIDSGIQTRPAAAKAGAIEGLADRIMDENRKQRAADPTVPELTFQDAVNIAHKAPNADQETIRRLSLAQGAWKAWTANPINMGKKDDPRSTPEYWDRFYGVSSAGQPGAAPPAAAPGATPARPAPAVPTSGLPTQKHVAYLKSHPETAAQFDAKYGNGSAAKVLAGGS